MGDREADQVLVERVQSGDKQAYGLLVSKYQRKLLRLISRLVRDPAEAEALIPKSPAEINADIADARARLTALRARASQGIPGPELDAHNAEESSTIQQIRLGEQRLQQARERQKQTEAIGSASAAGFDGRRAHKRPCDIR